MRLWDALGIHRDVIGSRVWKVQTNRPESTIEEISSTSHKYGLSVSHSSPLSTFSRTTHFEEHALQRL